jgi:hypothetical protein
MTAYNNSLSLWIVVFVAMMEAVHGNAASDTSSGQTLRIPTPDDYLVRGLEEIEPAFANYDGLMYAGLVPTTTLYPRTPHEPPLWQEKNDHPNVDGQGADDDAALMFWLYAPTNPVHTDTLLIWLNGGPGCSSCT